MMRSTALISIVGLAVLTMGCNSTVTTPSEAVQLDSPVPLFDGGGNGSYVTFNVRGMTFTSGGGFTTAQDRPDCSSSQLGWITGTGIPPYKITLIRACQAIAPAGGGDYLNGGQVQVNGTVGSAYGYLASVSGDLRQDFTAVDYPANGTVEFFGQNADGNCSFDQWRINSGGATTSSTQNPMTLTPQTGLEVVGWFICSTGGGGFFP